MGALFLSKGPWSILVKFDRGAGRNSQMEIKLSVEILQVAMTVDEARQNGLAFDIDHLCIGRNRDFAAPTDCLELACLDNDDGIFDRWPAGAIDQSSTLQHEYFPCHVFFLSLVPISRLIQDWIFLADTAGWSWWFVQKRLPSSSRRYQSLSAQYLMNRFNVNADPERPFIAGSGRSQLLVPKGGLQLDL
jgi:hypothetical protein